MRPALWVGLAVAAGIIVADAAEAQVRPDATLGAEGSRVRAGRVTGRDGATRDSDVIEGGAQRGGNLFHSFEQFDVPEGRGAYFGNPANVRNIFSRVTSTDRSEIFGTLGVLGNANLFFLNPNGILFGPNASLDVGGSFVGTTANSVQFGELGFFSATNPEAPALLTINPSAFLFNQIPTGNITNLSTAPAGFQPSGNPEFGLRVGDGQSLVLLGGDVEMDGGRINALGGRIELGGLASAGIAGLAIDGSTFRLIVPRNATLGNLILNNDARVSSRGTGGGDISVNVNQFTATNGGRLVAGTEGEGKSGDVTINANQIRLSGIGATGIESSINNQGVSSTGSININAQSLTLDSAALIGNLATSQTEGSTGDININTQTLSLRSGAIISNQVGFQSGRTGNINIVASDGITLTGSEIYTNAIGDATELDPTPTASSGNVLIATGSLTLQDESIISATSRFTLGSAGRVTIRARDSTNLTNSQIYSESIGGSAGDILLETNQLTVRQAGQSIIPIRSRTQVSNSAQSVPFGRFMASATRNGNLISVAQAQSGDLSIRATESIELNGSAGGISASSFAGNAGDIVVETGRLQILNGSEITADALANGAAGNIVITADSITLAGFSENPLLQKPLSSRITSSLNSGAAARASNITITANALSLQDGATIRTNTQGSSSGGNIRINARDQVELVGSTSPLTSPVTTISSSPLPSAAGSGGRISITVSNGRLRLLNGGQIIASAGGGRGGDIEIDANAIDVVGVAAFPSSASGLRLPSTIGSPSVNGTSESTALGDAGDITIRTNQLSLREGGTITSSTSGQGRGGDIRIDPRNLEIISSVEIAGVGPSTGSTLAQSGLTADTAGAARAGDVVITTNRLVLRDGGRIGLETTGAGRAGNIVINADAIELSGIGSGRFSFLSTTSLPGGESSGNAGDITIAANRLTLRDGARLSSAASGRGEGGTVRVNAREKVEIIGTGATPFGVLPSLISTSAEGNAARAGDVVIATGQLNVQDGGGISATTSSPGRGGDIQIDADALSLTGGSSLTASTSGRGNAGDITVRDADSVALNNGSISTEVADQNASGQGGDITIGTGTLNLNQGRVSSSTVGQGNTGSITVQASRGINLADNSSINSEVRQGAVGNSQNITLGTPELTLQQNSQISAATNGTGRAGSIAIRGTAENTPANSVSLNNSNLSTEIQQSGIANAADARSNIDIQTRNLNLNNGANITASTLGQGNAGNIRIQDANTVTLNNRSAITTAVNSHTATGDGGDIEIGTAQLRLNNSEISSSTSGTGDTGAISISATEAIGLRNQSRITSDVQAGAIGDSQRITLNTPALSLSGNSAISASTDGNGSAGDIRIQAANRVTLSGSAISTQVRDNAVVPRRANASQGDITLNTNALTLNNSEVTASSNGRGRAGNIRVNANRLEATNGGRLISSTNRSRSAGTITLRDLEQITLDGSDSRISANTTRSGRGGRIDLQTQTLTLNDGATISTTSQRSGQAGNIRISAVEQLQSTDGNISTSANRSAGGDIQITGGNIDLSAGSNIRTDVKQGRGDGGGITVNANAVRLRGDSDIQTQIGETGKGDGGDITVNASSVLAYDDSDIITQSPERGGDITLNTPVFFGSGYQPDTASTADGNGRVDLDASGTVSAGAVQTPDTSQIQNSLADLPNNALDTESLLANSCIARTKDGGIFLITGTGGLPPNRPGSAPLSPYPTDTVRTAPNAGWQPGDPIVEPQGVYRLPNGELVMMHNCQQ